MADEGLCRVGWASRAAALQLGTDRHSFGYGGTGKKSHAKQFEDYGTAYGKVTACICRLHQCHHSMHAASFPGSIAAADQRACSSPCACIKVCILRRHAGSFCAHPPFIRISGKSQYDRLCRIMSFMAFVLQHVVTCMQGDVVGCLLDGDHGQVSYTVNGQEFGPAHELPQHLQGQAVYPAVCLKNAEIVLNFGTRPFQFGPPHGFTAVSKLPASHLIAGAPYESCYAPAWRSSTSMFACK